MEFTEKNIYNAIKNVTRWNVLGINLGLSTDELDIIRKDSSDTSDAIIRLVLCWKRNDKEASWEKLASALRLMGLIDLADSLYHEDYSDVSSATNDEKMQHWNKDGEKLKSLVKSENVEESAPSSFSSTRNVALSAIVKRSILQLERKFQLMVKDIKQEIIQDERRIGELADILEYGLPHRLKGLRYFVTCTHITKDSIDLLFRNLEGVWSFLDYDLLRFIIYEFENIELMNKVDEYEKEVEIFCAQTTIHDLIANWQPRYDIDKIPEELKICVTELSLDVTSKVQELKRVQKKLKSCLPQELAMAAYYIYQLTSG